MIVDEGIPRLATETGAYFQGKLMALAEKHSFIEEVRGMGLLIAIQMTQDIAAATVTAALPEGLLINAVRPNMVRFMPPLNVTRDEIDEAVAILDKVFANTSN